MGFKPELSQLPLYIALTTGSPQLEVDLNWILSSVRTRSKKLPNVYKSCSKMISLENLKILPKNVGDLGKLIVAKGFEKLPKVQ